MGATKTPQTVVTNGAFDGYIDDRVISVMSDSIKLLGGCIGNARSVAAGREADPALEILLGLAMLTFTEAQALLMLCSGGHERSARIHLRSLCEYKVRADVILGDPERAKAFMEAALAELDYLGVLVSAPQAIIDNAKSQFFGDMPSAAQPKREKAALGGDMRTVLKNFSGDRTYASTFVWPSAFSHGSILALSEVSTALIDVGNDFQQPLQRDGRGAVYLDIGALTCCQFSTLLVTHFRMNALEQLESLMQRIVALTHEFTAPLNPYDTAG